MADELTIEQQRALALANGRMRMAQAAQAQQAPAPVASAPVQQPAAPAQVNPTPNLPPEIQTIRDIMRDPKTSQIERLGMIAPYLYYKGKDMAVSAGVRGLPVAAGDFMGRRIAGAPGAFVGRSLGGVTGSTIDQLRLMAQGQQKDFSMGQLGGDTVAAAMPGRGKIMGNPYVQGAGNIVAKAVEAGIDQKPLTLDDAIAAGAAGYGGKQLSNAFGLTPQLAAEGMAAERLKAFRALRPEGAVLPPHELGREGTGALSSVAGKAALQQESAIRNQSVYNKLTREDLGLSKEALPITKGDLDKVRVDAYEPYQTIKQISEDAQAQLKQIATAPGGHALAVQMSTPQAQKLLVEAGAQVDKLKEARFKSQQAYNSFKAGNPASYDVWQAAKKEAEDLSDKIDAAAVAHGDPGLLKRLNDARRQISKSYVVEQSLNGGSGWVDASELGRALDNGEPLTGNLAKIGKFALAFPREAIDATRVPSPNVNNLTAQLSMLAASQGKPGAIGGAVNATAGRLARPALLSSFSQNALAAPRLVGSKEFADVLTRYMAGAAGRDTMR